MHYIASDEALQSAAAQWRQSPVLGIDTEFIRMDTFHPIPALIQVSDGHTSWLVDVLHVRQLSPLSEILVQPAIVKIVHAAGEDLEVFDQLLGHLPQPLFDTQIAASLCGHGASIGYARLVQALLGIELAKDQCRSDWLARPLTAEQQHYASLDVLHLPALYQQLQQGLAQRGRLPWATEDNARLLSRYHEQRSSAYNIERINHAWRLDPAGRQRLWHLLLGRDALARAHNKPRNHIAKDFALLELARKPPRHLTDLAAIEGIRPSAVRQFGQHLIQLAQDVPADILCPPVPEPLGRAENERVKRLRSLADAIATREDIPVEILVRKQDLEQLVRQHQASQPLQWADRFEGWRHGIIRQPLLEEIQAWPGVTA